jgi:hypothetical protein
MSELQVKVDSAIKSKIIKTQRASYVVHHLFVRIDNLLILRFILHKEHDRLTYTDIVSLRNEKAYIELN